MRVASAAALAAALAAAACTRANPNYCADAAFHRCDAGAADMTMSDGAAGGGGDGRDGRDGLAESAPACRGDDDCKGDGATLVCDTAATPPRCVQCTAAAPSACTGATPICAATGTCRACTSNPECKTRDPAAPACVAGTCLPCGVDADCTADAAKPICAANACRACKADAECTTGAGVCLESGRCAASTDVIFVQYSAAGCAGADGSLAKPYCAPNDGVAALTASNRTVLVIRGPSNGQLAWTAAGATPVIVGEANGAGEAASIPAVVATGISVTGGDVLVRDLGVVGGTAAGSKGVVVNGSGTRLRLIRVTVAIGTGLGLQADGGAELDMDQCVVKGNSGGGLLLNRASYDIANSVFAGNGYGVQFTGATIPNGSRFWFDTVVASVGNALTCDPGNVQTVTGSIVIGPSPSCTLDHTVIVMPALDADYHLTSKAPCPLGDPALFPDHDIDGDPRTSPLDCGADQRLP